MSESEPIGQRAHILTATKTPPIVTCEVKAGRGLTRPITSLVIR